MSAKRKHKNVAVAEGNHRIGYNGRIDRIFDDGRQEAILAPCDHRHPTTHAARTCAVVRMTEKRN